MPLKSSLSQRRSAILACILLVLYIPHMTSWKVRSVDVSYLSHSPEPSRMTVHSSEETGQCTSLKSQHPVSLVSPFATSDFRADAFSESLTPEVHHTQLQPGPCLSAYVNKITFFFMFALEFTNCSSAERNHFSHQFCQLLF